MYKTRVMIVDDQFTSRQLFDLYIKQSESFETVRMVESASEVIAHLNSTQVDLILMDILMNDSSNGLDAAAKVKKLRPDIKIIAVTSMAEASWLRRAREIGIDSSWFKDASKETILSVMERTMAGESVYPDSPPLVKLGCAASNEFTERELDVLRCMTKGMSNAAIGKKLGMSENTVKTHIQHMLDKTGYENRTELAIEARISGAVVSLET